MMGPTHRLVGGTTGLVAATAVGLPIAADAAFALVAGASSSLPDDLERLLHLSHRRLTHYPVLQLVFIGALTYVALRFSTAPAVIVVGVGGAIELGCLMHSVVDSMTVDPRGIALFWPIKRRGVHLMPHSLRVWVDSDSRSETTFCVVWVSIVLCYLYVQFGYLIRR